MKNAGKMGTLTGPSKKIEASGLDELMGQLDDFVGSSGSYMPFTKSVELQLPKDSLKDIQIVDTPGVNDPVASREERTKEYLKNCDVVFILSPAGQFVSHEDIELMDRLSSKEGVQEMYFVASQVDNQLHGDELETSGHDLHKAINNVKGELSKQARDTLHDLKEKNPLVAQQFGKLIEEIDSRVMVSSAICHAMSIRFNEKDRWDSSMTHV
jgi:predicted GTPase